MLYALCVCSMNEAFKLQASWFDLVYKQEVGKFPYTHLGSGRVPNANYMNSYCIDTWYMYLLAYHIHRLCLQMFSICFYLTPRPNFSRWRTQFIIFSAYDISTSNFEWTSSELLLRSTCTCTTSEPLANSRCTNHTTVVPYQYLKFGALTLLWCLL